MSPAKKLNVDGSKMYVSDKNKIQTHEKHKGSKIYWYFALEISEIS